MLDSFLFEKIHCFWQVRLSFHPRFYTIEDIKLSRRKGKCSSIIDKFHILISILQASYGVMPWQCIWWNLTMFNSKHLTYYDVYCDKSLLPVKLAIMACQFTIDWNIFPFNFPIIFTEIWSFLYLLWQRISSEVIRK